LTFIHSSFSININEYKLILDGNFRPVIHRITSNSEAFPLPLDFQGFSYILCSLNGGGEGLPTIYFANLILLVTVRVQLFLKCLKLVH